MYEVDFARGLAYKGKKGYIIRLHKKGLYIKEKFKKTFLTEENTIQIARASREVQNGIER